MNSIFIVRLVLDSVAAGLLVFAFAYHWQGNAAHELAGIGMFMLVVVHNLFHRRWFSMLSKGKHPRRGSFNVALTFVLLAGMLVLLVSSLVISETLFADFRLTDDFTARQIHAGVAYWLLLIVAVHLGLRWALLMAVSRRLFDIVETNTMRTSVLRVIAMAIAAQGICSMVALNVHSRLLFQLSLDWWNFEESAWGFFGHCLAVVGFWAFVTHYTMHRLSRWRRRATGAQSCVIQRDVS
jgi:Domain of unknown function (DUF4405)